MPKPSQYERFEMMNIRIRRVHKRLLETICARTGRSQREFIEAWIERECEHDATMKRYKRLIENFRTDLHALEEGKGDDHPLDVPVAETL